MKKRRAKNKKKKNTPWFDFDIPTAPMSFFSSRVISYPTELRTIPYFSQSTLALCDRLVQIGQDGTNALFEASHRPSYPLARFAYLLALCPHVNHGFSINDELAIIPPGRLVTVPKNERVP